MNRTLRALLVAVVAVVSGCDRQVPLPTDPASLTMHGRAAVVGENTYQSTDVPKSILDNQTASSTALASNSGFVSKVTVSFSITHAFDADMVISLVSPAGTIVTLVNRRGLDGENYVSTTLDDNATSTIASGVAPFTGTFSPDQPLATFAGENAQGTWTLRVQDVSSGDQGSLSAWSLTITTTDTPPPPPTDVVHTFQSTDVPKAILDVATVTSTLQVPAFEGIVQKITVQFSILHTFDMDLRISLTSPGGAITQLLVNRRGGGGKHFTNTILADNASLAIFQGSAPFSGTFRPEQPLSGFIGPNPEGTWTMTVQDLVGGDVGQITNWSLSFTTPPPNVAPIAVAGEDQTVTRTSAAGANVVLDGTGSSDSDGIISNYEWLENGDPIASGSIAQRVFALGTHVLTLRVTDNKGKSTDDEVVITVENAPPTAAAGADQTAARGSPAGVNVTLDGTGSSDLDGTIGYEWLENDGPIASGATPQHVFALGTHVVTLRVTDNDGAQSEDQVVITVGNVPPTVTVSPPLTFNCTARGATANFVATGADVDGTVTYSWSPTGATTATTSFFAPLGTTQVLVTVTDNDGASAQALSSVTVSDAQQPVISMVVSPTTLLSANHMMVKVASGISVSDACDSSPRLRVTVTSNESVNGLGDGNTAVDSRVVRRPNGTYDVYVRAERAASGTGRVYTITATAIDASGNTSSRTQIVSVPRSQGGQGGQPKKKTAVAQ